METETTIPTGLQTLVNLYDWHTKLYKNAIDGISDEDARNRLNTKANHLNWIAGSLVQERFELARLFGIDLKQTSDDIFKNHQGIKDDIIYPSLEEYRKDWDRISPVLREALTNATDEKLKSPDPWEMPGGPFTFFDSITACADRESYCIGQIGLYRRLLGYAAMKYE